MNRVNEFMSGAPDYWFLIMYIIAFDLYASSSS